MKDNSGFFIFLVAILIIGAFFVVEPVDITTEKPTNEIHENEQISENDPTPTTVESLREQIADAKKQVEKTEEELKQAQIENSRSIYYGKVDFDYINTSWKEDPNEEYLKLSTSYNVSDPIDITGWTIRSTYTGNHVTIPQGTQVYMENGLSNVSDILVKKNQSIYITTGRSPLGESFQLNICSGYQSQYKKFTPSISQYCPAPIDDVEGIPPSMQNTDCLDFIDNMPRCRTQTELVPNFSYECTTYIKQKVNYKTCVEKHRNDTDFYKNEWRVFLNKNEILWRDSHEKLELYDSAGKLVGTESN